MITSSDAWHVYNSADLLFDESQVVSAIEKLAVDVSKSLKERNPLVLCVMNGGLFLTAELTKRLDFPLQMDYIQATRYRGQTTGSEEVHWLAPPKQDLTGRDVLIVDDILDEGHTLVAITEECQRLGANSVQVVVLLRKKHDRCHPDAQADFVGLVVKDRYVFGCGMDYKDYLRNLPGIYAVKE